LLWPTSIAERRETSLLELRLLVTGGFRLLVVSFILFTTLLLLIMKFILQPYFIISLYGDATFVLTAYIYYILGCFLYLLFHLLLNLTNSGFILYYTYRLNLAFSLLSFNAYSVVNRLVIDLRGFFQQTELLLQDGLFIDFLQKQSLELWLRQFILATGCIFSERLVFETLIKFFFTHLLWPIKLRLNFETANTSDLLVTTFYFLLTLFLLLVSIFLFY